MKGSMRLVAALPAAMVVLPMLAFAVGLHVPTPLIIFLLLFGLIRIAVAAISWSKVA